MFIFGLILLGLAFGSFINALIWRIYKQSKQKKRSKKYSISTGRSMCVSCGHELSARDLVPVVSWVMLKGRCRYCSKKISVQYPLVEILTACLFLISYLVWPAQITGEEWVVFGLWLATLCGLIALLIYDIRWMILPNRIIFVLYFVAFMMFLIKFMQNPEVNKIMQLAISILVGGGIFYILFQVSSGRWIGGGDVKLGFLIGALVLTPDKSLLVLFLASLLGCLYIIPAIGLKKISKNSRIPFGPFLIVATILVFLVGDNIIGWYLDNLLMV